MDGEMPLETTDDETLPSTAGRRHLCMAVLWVEANDPDEATEIVRSALLPPVCAGKGLGTIVGFTSEDASDPRLWRDLARFEIDNMAEAPL